jgi:hypothetical protein
MNPIPSPSTRESAERCAGEYSLRQDLQLNGWLAVSAVVYLVTLFLGRRHPEWSLGARASLALLPLVPGILYVRGYLGFVAKLDELQRRLQLEAWLIAAIGTALVGAAVSTLGSLGVRLGGFDLQHGLGIGQTFFVGYFLGSAGIVIARWRIK